MKLSILLALTIVGCSAVPISDRGMQVRQMQENDSSACRFIRVVEVSGGMFYSRILETKRDMLAKVRDEVANVGGNAYVSTAIVVEHGVSLRFAQADVYKFP